MSRSWRSQGDVGDSDSPQTTTAASCEDKKIKEVYTRLDTGYSDVKGEHKFNYRQRGSPLCHGQGITTRSLWDQIGFGTLLVFSKRFVQ